MKKLIRPLVNFFVDIYLSVFKRDQQVVVCSGWSGERFADNSRYMFLYLNEHKQCLNLKKIVWLTGEDSILWELKEAGYTVYKKYSVRSLYYHLRACSFFYDQFSDDFFVFLTRKARLINLWHGMPIKKFGLWNGKNWDLKNNYLLTCSKMGDSSLGGAFHVRTDRMIHGMYPRNYFLREGFSFLTREEKQYMERLKEQQKRGRKIVFYLPTFRKDRLLFLGEADSEKLSVFFDFLSSQNYFLMTKIHYAGYFYHQDGVGCSALHLMNLSPKIDIYPFLREADILITDYSSVFFDYLYLDRDIICYPYDLDDYSSADQGLLLDYKSLPADIVYTLPELQENLHRKRTTRDHHSGARKDWLVKCFENHTMDDTIENAMKR